MAKKKSSRKRTKKRHTLRSEFLAKNIETMPNRALMFATGMSRSQVGRPLIGVASSFTDLVPGSLLDLEPGSTAALVELEQAVAARPEYLPLATQLHLLASRSS